MWHFYTLELKLITQEKVLRNIFFSFIFFHKILCKNLVCVIRGCKQYTVEYGMYSIRKLSIFFFAKKKTIALSGAMVQELSWVSDVRISLKACFHI